VVPSDSVPRPLKAAGSGATWTRVTNYLNYLIHTCASQTKRARRAEVVQRLLKILLRNQVSGTLGFGGPDLLGNGRIQATVPSRPADLRLCRSLASCCAAGNSSLVRLRLVAMLCRRSRFTTASTISDDIMCFSVFRDNWSFAVALGFSKYGSTYLHAQVVSLTFWRWSGCHKD
jgi:hypothetical protein